MRKEAGLIKWLRSNFLKNFSLVLICCVCATPDAPAQSINGRITGAITDQSGAVISNLTYDLDFLAQELSSWPKRLTEGWQLSGIYTGSSGLPITPFLSVDVSGTGELNDRPNLVGDPNSGAQRDAAQVFNKAAFALPALGSFGTSGRNTIIGPNLHIVDLSVNKATKLTERLAIQFCAEFFNLFNHANFSLPNVDFTSAAFGSISETPDVTAGNPRLGEGGPRVGQFALKLIF